MVAFRLGRVLIPFVSIFLFVSVIASMIKPVPIQSRVNIKPMVFHVDGKQVEMKRAYLCAGPTHYMGEFQPCRAEEPNNHALTPFAVVKLIADAQEIFALVLLVVFILCKFFLIRVPKRVSVHRRRLSLNAETTRLRLQHPYTNNNNGMLVVHQRVPFNAPEIHAYIMLSQWISVLHRVMVQASMRQQSLDVFFVSPSLSFFYEFNPLAILQPSKLTTLPSRVVVSTRNLVTGPAPGPPSAPYPTALPFGALLQKRVVVLNVRSKTVAVLSYRKPSDQVVVHRLALQSLVEDSVCTSLQGILMTIPSSATIASTQWLDAVFGASSMLAVGVKGTGMEHPVYLFTTTSAFGM